jgi:hypothetical protein
MSAEAIECLVEAIECIVEARAAPTTPCFFV